MTMKVGVWRARSDSRQRLRAVAEQKTAEDATVDACKETGLNRQELGKKNLHDDGSQILTKHGTHAAMAASDGGH